jgi:gas vesicle protein
VELERKQRNAIIVGALAGAVLGAGTGWLLVQTAPQEPGQARKPIRPLDIFQVLRDAAGLLRQVDDLRYRM